MIDSHAHLTDRKYEKDLTQVLQRARSSGINAIINVGFDLESSREGIELAENHDWIFAAVGFHPHDASKLDKKALEELEKMSSHPKVVAIGEIGLDFYRNLSPRHVQEEAFRLQLELARRVDLPVIIHDRDAHRKVISILKESSVRGVLHCFSGDINIARQGLELGFHISFAGPVTYDGKKAAEIIRKMPLERLLIETDCPYLAPVPFRGKRNEPAYLKYTLERIAEIVRKTPSVVERVTEENTRRVFNLSF